MNVLLIGSGGREHALAWSLAQSKDCDTLYCAPGNAGIEACATCIDIESCDVDGIVRFAQDNKIDLVVVGPEQPLVSGLADPLRALGISVFGASKAASQLEGSKAFMKDLCAKYNIPTARYGRFTSLDDAKVFIESMSPPIVIKTDGLAAGKGVIIAETHDVAIEAAVGMLTGDSFGAAGKEIIVEEFLDGEELSYFALADGKTILPLTSAQDHKRAFDGDKGPNTGGMGAYSPAHLITDDLEQKILDRIIKPTIDGMAEEGCPFTGVLFAGIMVVKGEPILLEHNIRFGDPECQVILPRLDGHLLEILNAAAQGRLNEVQNRISWKSETAHCVGMASNGYPGAYTKGSKIGNIGEAEISEAAIVFHAGTKKNEHGEILSAGGRVLGITATGSSVVDAQRRAYNAISHIDWPEGFYRKDIGWRAV